MNITPPEPVGALPVEPDFVEGNPASPEAFHELKTGEAQLSPETVSELTKISPPVPVAVLLP